MNLLLKPFGALVSDKVSGLNYNGEKLNAVYIPSLEHRQVSKPDLFQLSKYTEEIVFLYSDSVEYIHLDNSTKVRIESLQSYQKFLFNFISKKGNINAGIKWRKSFDIPHKRSFALNDARNRGYHKILLIDDDVHLSEENIMMGIIALQTVADIVGFHVVDYPDVSTVDHLERIILEKENIISMTGSCLFLNVETVIGDFPNIYNEDLFFFLAQSSPERIVSGGLIYQDYYVPWNSIERICHEQFGDLIYDSIKKRLLGKTHERINWNEEIADRINRIQKIKSKSQDVYQQDALNNAVTCLKSISESDINVFVKNYAFADWVINYLE